MDKQIKEAVTFSQEPRVCAICGYTGHYFDLLDDESLSCLLCTYKYGFTLAKGAILETAFDPSNKDLLKESFRVAEHEVDKTCLDADNQLAVMLPTEIRSALSELALEHQAGLNTVITAGLGYFLASIYRS